MTIPRPETQQFQSFTTNLDYARKMINAGQSLHGLRPEALDVGDLYRAAWVQAVSAVDHWLHEELYRRVGEIAEDAGAEKPAALENFELPLAYIEQVRRGEAELADKVVEHVKAKWAYIPMHNPSKIVEAYKLVPNGADLWGRAAQQINEWHRGRVSYNGRSLRAKFSEIVERRNKIAHYADLEDGDLGRRRPVTAADASDAVDWIERIALAIAKVLA
ncbi:hypothetical protein [Streptomyces lycii]|uniref:RiboL-PSP-HEPN domain-containing protein n=1 Tax=Streptomyces lycii TaxID=2654337 RepID=A0ABQ7FPW4_9ACTN|nr:hypothetical protein [Streptomyces lycii]KAF4410971.1 hypothetical protein GCU69_01035 [Streptomyces lycii]